MINIFNKNNLKPYIIAEAGVNHENSFKKALRLIDLAKKGGANAIKFQTYKAEKLASIYSPAYWDTKKEKTKNQFELFSKYDRFEKEDYIKLAKYCKSKKIDFLSTPFDNEAVDFLNPLVNFFKVASADITNHQLLQKIASKKKPVLISTGASNIDEIKDAIKIFKSKGIKKICLMHCVLNYPTTEYNANLLMIKHLSNEFKEYPIGYSDHTLPDKNFKILTTAFSMGAKIIEKHFTYDKSLSGNDHYHAVDYKDLKKLVKKLSNLEKIIGNSKNKFCLKSENNSRKFARRSIVASKIIKIGERITLKNTTSKRPGNGIAPNNIKKILNRKAKTEIKKDRLITFKNLY